MIKSLVKKILFRPKGDTAKLIAAAQAFPRFTPHTFQYRGLTLTVTDFISVAWQLKEFYDDGRMKFKSDGFEPVIYDCGSNVGVSVLYYKTMFPKAKVKAFEPDPMVVQCLKKNLSANKIADVELFEKAVWINNDGVSFGSEGADGGSVFFEGNKVSLPSVRLKELLEKESKIDLLKMDIEGAELQVLLDCMNELSKIKYLFVEYHSWVSNKQELNVLLDLLTQCGFRYYIHSIGEVLKQPFVDRTFSNGMDVQLDIHAVNERL